jgi:sugar phosphate isomerase/epimerase
MFVACSTLCFATEPLGKALRLITELEFDKFELALIEDGRHLKPSEAGDNPEAALQVLRSYPSLAPSALHFDFGPVDWSDPVTRKRFDGLCRLAKSLSIAVMTTSAAPLGNAVSQEIMRLTPLVSATMREGLVLALLTHAETLTADPRVAVELCQLVPGLGLTLDPSHYIQGPQQNVDYDIVFPYVQNVHLRDTGLSAGDFQVRVGQGQIEYARIVTQLQRHGYNRALTVAIIDRPDSPFEREVELRKLKLLLETLL